MKAEDLIFDLQPEELDPRLEMQILVDPLSLAFNPQDTNNNIDCQVRGACIIKVPQ